PPTSIRSSPQQACGFLVPSRRRLRAGRDHTRGFRRCPRTRPFVRSRQHERRENPVAIRVAINGFGRTGRAAFRAAHERGADVEWVAINDVAEPAMLAQLLRHDSVYGPFAGLVEAEEGALVVDGRRIVAPAETDPARLPWDELDV